MFIFTPSLPCFFYGRRLSSFSFPLSVLIRFGSHLPIFVYKKPHVLPRTREQSSPSSPAFSIQFPRRVYILKSCSVLPIAPVSFTHRSSRLVSHSHLIYSPSHAPTCLHHILTSYRPILYNRSYALARTSPLVAGIVAATSSTNQTSFQHRSLVSALTSLHILCFVVHLLVSVPRKRNPSD